MGDEWEDLEGSGWMVPYRTTVCSLTIREPDPLTTLIIAALAIAFAAFCIWLGVRIVNRREKWSKRLAIILAIVSILYPLSSGPATWILIKAGDPDWLYKPVRWLYTPHEVVVVHGPEWLQTADMFWGTWWTELAAGNETELE
jgi:hypothetical protein